MLVKFSRDVSHRYSVLRAQNDVKKFFALSVTHTHTHTHTQDTELFPRKLLRSYIYSYGRLTFTGTFVTACNSECSQFCYVI
jgi:hypothetical protein